MSPTGVVLPVLGQSESGWLVSTPCGITVTVTSGVPVTATVVIDPGHGGAEDPGAVGDNGLTESEVNLAVAERARAALERQGVAVVLTRSADYQVTLEGRAKVARSLKARVFVSVHHNAGAETPLEGPGTDVYHQEASAESRRLGGLVYEEVVAALRPLPADWVGVPNPGVKYLRGRRGTDYYGVLRRTAGLPGVLSEAAYLSNPSEADLLARADVQALEAEAISRAIVRFLTTADPGVGFVAADDEPGPPPPLTPAERAPLPCTDPPLE